MPEDTSPYRLIGLDHTSENIYLFVLRAGRASTHVVAEHFGLDEQQAGANLEALRDRGLLARRQGDTGDYAPVDPRFAFRSLSDRLTDGVRRIQDEIPTLAAHFDRTVATFAESPETQVLSDPDAVASWYGRLQHQVTHEFMAFDRPPYVTASMDPLEEVSIDRGVRWRAIYAADSFEVSGTWDEVEYLASRGEQARIVADLPLKLAIVDRSIALVSLSHEPGSIDALVTESAPLVAAFCDLFEFYWERALRVSADRALPAHAQEVSPGATQWKPSAVRRPTHEEQSLLALVGAGLKDEVIARQLGMSPRTLRRRSQDLMTELGAANRFQAGVEAARRGWI